MRFSRQLGLRRFYRWAILFAVGLLGLLITGWVSRSLSDSEQERMAQRFELAARARADAVVTQMRQPEEHLAILQRLFGSVDQVDWPAFAKFTRPMLKQPGVRSYNWFPRVAAGATPAFENDARQRWGPGFAIAERDRDGQLVAAAARDYYFPLLYSVPEELGRRNLGLDLMSIPARVPLVNQAIDTSLPMASEIGPLLIDNQQTDVILMIAPVYRGGLLPTTRDARRAAAGGILVALLNVKALFHAANAGTPESDFNVRLFDRRKAPDKQLIAMWPERQADARQAASAAPLRYAEEFALASHVWSVQIEAAPAWIEANSLGGLGLVTPLGALATIVLLFYLHTLLGRSALADTLKVTHEDDVQQRRLAESWADKLLMAVDQNPATVYISDLDGRIEYVNDQFVETTGYTRAEAIGQNSRMLRPLGSDDAVYRDLWQTVEAGRSWRGELQTRRRDGTLCWDRTLISPIKDRDGMITNYMAIKENISELREVMNRFQESESRFLGAMSVMVEGLAIMSPDGNFVYANRAANEFMGGPEGGLQGRRPQELALERLREDGSLWPVEETPALVTLREGRGVYGAVLGFRYPDRTIRWMEVNTTSLRTGQDERWGVVMTLSDITARRRAEEQLKLAFEAIKCSGEGILVTDSERRILSANPAFEAVTGFAAAELIGKTPAFFASERCDEGFYSAMDELLERTGHWQGEVWNQRKDGEAYPEWLGVSAVRGDDGRAKNYVYIFSDMTERKAAQRRIEFLAHHDPLTGLPNRLLLRDRVEQARTLAGRLHSRVALLFLDLDHFKTINDSLGHPVGDDLLKAVVERLKHCVRESDTISRQGGDEFIILLNDVRDSEAVARVADKIQQRMAEPFVLGNHSLSSTFSIGIALYPDDGEDFDSLLQKADTAMYHAKESGRNNHRFFTAQMNLQVVEHMTLQTQLRLAIENQEFVLHYQPQMDLSDGRIYGVEALIRWNSPENGLIEPGKFIEVAEDSGLIVPIGAWVLNEACRQARAWQDAGLPPFVVAVNLSAVQFKRLDLVATVINALVISDLDAQWLELELTESILIQDAEATLDAVRRLKALGVRLSVDDFGTGYSSLTYLKRFAVDKLKIDQSFIRDLATDPDDAAIVRAIIQMARSLKLKTIAEGVESEELIGLLQAFQCDEIQGYWFARPMPADQLAAFVRQHEDRRAVRGVLAESA
jgi:diguanylate cyclase (GGDEF)-like protein/PAS domain S-box-containing protein